MKKGFTLLELLIVIGILAVLSTTMVLVINPAEMLRRARDSQRISDLNTIKSALAFYLTEAASPDLDGVVSSGWFIYQHPGITVNGTSCAGKTTKTLISSQAVNGTGWIPVNLSDLTGGSPISGYPVDPNPYTDKRYYIYLPDQNTYTFELLANMESTTYSAQEATDGGLLNDVYEVGTRMIATATTGCYANTGQ